MNAHLKPCPLDGGKAILLGGGRPARKQRERA
jgi:hypothetical protein